MNKREFLKTGLLGLAAASVALSGCDKNDTQISNDGELNIEPKQTATYEFSCPLPFNYKTIDDLVELNSKYKKSQVVSFYNNAPNQNFNHWISIARANNSFVKTYDDFFKYVDYAHDKGFKVSYLMNSPKPFSDKDYKTFEKEFKYLLDLLAKHNVEDIKVANTQLPYIIDELYPDTFNFHASTAFEYTNVSQYKYLFQYFPKFSLIDITNGENHNFHLLKGLRDKFSNTKLELMVNEQCIKGCPARISCISESNYRNYSCFNLWLSGQNRSSDMSMMHFFIKTGIIYPWNLEYYSALGINNFKFISSYKTNSRANYHDLKNLKAYLDCVEYGCEGVGANDLLAALCPKLGMKYQREFEENKHFNKMLPVIKDLFPDIKHFVKHGHECAYKCGTECNYCYECSKEIEKILINT